MSTSCRLIIMSIFTFTQSILFGYFSEIPQEESQKDEAKIYVDPSDITISHDGIYWNCSGGQIPIRSVQVDAGGLSVTPLNQEQARYTTYTCPGCQKTYHWWENCDTKDCLYNPKTRK